MKTDKSRCETVTPAPSDPTSPGNSKRILDAQWDGRSAFFVPEIAVILGISRWAAYEAVKKGEIPAVQIMGRKIIPRHTIERLLNV